MAEIIKKDHNCRFYRAWCHMKHRCLNKNDKAYKNYGGRGITICKEWLLFDNFRKDMEQGYDLNLTLDRIDNDKGYSKENCRWVSFKAQNNNRRSNRLITFKGKTRTLMQWSEELGIKRTTLGMRMDQYKWSIEKSFTKEVRNFA